MQEIADSVTHAVKADATDMDVVRSLGLNNLDAVVIAIGNNLEASISNPTLSSILATQMPCRSCRSGA